MDYEFGIEMAYIVTTADMLEIAASGGNGSEYVDIVGLMENAAKELREKDAEIERLRESALEIVYQIGQGDYVAAMDIAAKIAEAAVQQKESE